MTFKSSHNDRLRRPAIAIAAAPTSSMIANAVTAERERIESILNLPIAKSNPRGAKALAFGTMATPAEASGAMIAADEKRKMARERSKASMLKIAGIPDSTKTLTAGQISAIKLTARNGLPGNREAARAMLKTHKIS